MAKTFTGRTRHRIHTRWFRKPLMVLQREYRYTGFDLTNDGGMVDSRPYDFLLWEDAPPYFEDKEDV